MNSTNLVSFSISTCIQSLDYRAKKFASTHIRHQAGQITVVGKGQHNHKCMGWACSNSRLLTITIRTPPGPDTGHHDGTQARVIATNFQHANQDPRHDDVLRMTR